MVSAVMCLCDIVKTSVWLGSAYSEEFEIKIDAHQGSMLSPLLFAMVVGVTTENERRGEIN